MKNLLLYCPEDTPSDKFSSPGQEKEAAKAFTLVELIVVITILAILGTIAFISLQGYSASSRDSVRISDVSNMKTSLELFHLNAGKYPLPDNDEIVSYNSETLWYQGTFGSTVVSQLSRNISEIPTDSLSDKEYIYSVANNKNEFEILNLLEGDLVYSPHTIFSQVEKRSYIFEQTNAANTTRIPRIDGQYNGVFIKTAKDIVPTPSIITSEKLPMALNGTNIKSQIITLGENIPNIGGINSATGKLDISLSVYNGTINKDSTPGDKVLLMQAIQGAYTGSELANSDIYAHILSKTSTGDLIALVDTVVLKNSTTTAVVELATGAFNISQTEVIQGTNVTITNTCSTQPTSYTSSNTSVATILGTTITTLSAGTTDITPIGGTCEDYDSKTLTVTAPPNTFLLNCNANGQIYYTDNTGNRLATVTKTGVATWVTGKSISDLTCEGHIIMCNGNNSGYTLQACNVGANIVGTSTTSYGGLYQWGNHFDFRYNQFTNGQVYPTTSTTQVSLIPNYSTYSTLTFVKLLDWTSLDSDGVLRSASWNPCSSGYHVPTNSEWIAINTAGLWGEIGANMSNALKMPFAGERIHTNASLNNQGIYGNYWSSSPNGARGYKMFFSSSDGINPSSHYYRSSGFSVRCFKN